MSRAPNLNAICAYFTMFPFDFPASVLSGHSADEGAVLDPFCGRGTTNLAARAAGLPTLGIDSSPVAAAIAQAKLIHADPDAIVQAAWEVVESSREPVDVPTGEFWTLAYHPHVLRQLCLLREALMRDSRANTRIALRAIILGALHGPQNKGVPTYFSNQAPRTFAPKPGYAVRFWRARGMSPPPVDVVGIISRRANHYYSQRLPSVEGAIRLGDSRDSTSLEGVEPSVGLVITSPPYYGMRTYVPDQWLRWWFLGGPDVVDYSRRAQLEHASPAVFAAEMRAVWRNVARVSLPDARMVIRFGAINDRKVDPRDLIRASLADSGWYTREVATAGSAHLGKRQANLFAKHPKAALEEYDFFAERA